MSLLEEVECYGFTCYVVDCEDRLTRRTIVTAMASVERAARA